MTKPGIYTQFPAPLVYTPPTRPKLAIVVMGDPKTSHFNSYYTDVYGRVLNFPRLPSFTLDPYLLMVSGLAKQNQVAIVHLCVGAIEYSVFRSPSTRVTNFIYIYIYIYIYIHTHTHKHFPIYIYIYIHTHLQLFFPSKPIRSSGRPRPSNFYQECSH